MHSYGRACELGDRVIFVVIIRLREIDGRQLYKVEKAIENGNNFSDYC